MIFFIVTNPIGNCPMMISLVKDYPLRQQQKILFREAMFSLLLAIAFLFLGESFIHGLAIENYALTISGGVLLFIVAMHMIFSNSKDSSLDQPKQTPFIVPIATPLLSGAGLLTMIILYSKQEANDFKLLLAILLAWTGIALVLVMAPYLLLFLGKKGLAALEQLMGMLLTMIAIEMIVHGSHLFLLKI